ncbi:MAG: putative peptidoglycan glycosyltransferase FtsW [Asticcacaulis sp.]|uniref:FtsW/RodA/SpoVE family cell cycle protein n=1 Tax=Asticcacaulis tiandongensis TaxID=2565365 RepID=UPI00112D4849|nr:putative peptidoglycan glycosyltransferase FtsW [Asticcacaulis tiandongensis]
MPQGYAHPFTRTDRSPLAIWWWTVDRVTLASVLLLIFAGLVFSFSSSPVAAPKIGSANDFYYTQRHLIFAVASATLMISVSMLSLKGVRRVSTLIYGGALTIMALLPFIGHKAKGGRRWLDLEFFSLQPSEFIKPALIVLIAWMFAESQKGRGVPGVTIAVILYVLCVGLLLIQPDAGQTILITLVFGACFFISGVPMRWIIGMSGAAVVGMVSLYFALPHFRSRIQEFVSPEGDRYQVERAAAAIANGGIFGTGTNEGTMKRLIPDMHTDFIYSVAAEEYGLWVSLLLIALFSFVVLRGLWKAMNMPDPFRQIATSGLYIIVGLQVFINVAVNLSVIPPKGMTLPFISYGGSSLMAMGLTMGLILALTRKRPAEVQPDDPTKW